MLTDELTLIQTRDEEKEVPSYADAVGYKMAELQGECVAKAIEIAGKNNLRYDKIFTIKDNAVNVNLGFGYSFNYFTSNQINLIFDRQRSKLVIGVS